MNVLAHRNIAQIEVRGTVAVNGHPTGLNINTMSAYIQQEDLFIGSLTVREHLTFQVKIAFHVFIWPRGWAYLGLSFFSMLYHLIIRSHDCQGIKWKKTGCPHVIIIADDQRGRPRFLISRDTLLSDTTGTYVAIICLDFHKEWMESTKRNLHWSQDSVRSITLNLITRVLALYQHVEHMQSTALEQKRFRRINLAHNS